MENYTLLKSLKQSLFFQGFPMSTWKKLLKLPQVLNSTMEK